MSAYKFVLDLANELRWPVVVVIIAIVAIVICRAEVRDFIKRMYSISPTGGVKATRQNPQIVTSNTGSGPALTSPDFRHQLSATVDPYVLDQRVNTIYAEFDSRGIGPGHREEHLIPLLAAALIRESWERTYLWIFGTQMRVLQKLNESLQGLTEERGEQHISNRHKPVPGILSVVSVRNLGRLHGSGDGNNKGGRPVLNNALWARLSKVSCRARTEL
jgi:hypothetical protein